MAFKKREKGEYEMKRLLILLGIGVLLFYIGPFILRNSKIEALGLMVIALLIIYPLYSLVAGFLVSKWKWIFPLFIGLLFVPAIYIFYNDSAWAYPIKYTIIAYVGVILSCIKKRSM